VRFKVVGMQFDEAGQKIVALEIDASRRRPMLADLLDAAVFDRDIAREHAIGGDDPRVLEHA
jgi:hypothetical protein